MPGKQWEGKAAPPNSCFRARPVVLSVSTDPFAKTIAERSTAASAACRPGISCLPSPAPCLHGSPNAMTLSEQAAGAQVKLRPFTNVLVEMSLLIDGCRQFLHCTALTKPQPRLVMCQSETRAVLSYRCSNKILHTAVNVSIR